MGPEKELVIATLEVDTFLFVLKHVVGVFKSRPL